MWSVLAVWLGFGLLNYFVMTQADKAARESGFPYLGSWVSNKIVGFLASLALGPLMFPLTLVAAIDWWTSWKRCKRMM